MITVFDALLVSLWATVTALGVRRGLGGAVWGFLGVAVCFMVDIIATGGLFGFVAAALVGVTAAVSARRLIREPLTEPWHLAVGGVGGFTLGGLLVGALALGFPIQNLGDHQTYPSTDLPSSLYYMVSNSYVRQSLSSVMEARSNPVLRTLLVPDQQRALILRAQR
ncbi:hypothetical protein [Deinococcus sp.]|uniref:hypothetical protein n=1 Tax=Deinococcus sp. TaxID=47478 RepID=UPI003CC63D94